MNDNKPVLFINSAQSNEVKDKNQYVYDSRFDKKTVIIKKEAKEEPIVDKKRDTMEVKKQDLPINKEEIKEPVADNRDQKALVNKIDLLQKRARLGRYVLVAIDEGSNRIEGLFIERSDDEIMIRPEDERDIRIRITDIKNITILKV